MQIYDTKFFSFNDGTAVWLKIGDTSLPEGRTQTDVKSEEIRKVLKADDKFMLKDKDGNILGYQIWLPDGTIPEGVSEIDEDEAKKIIEEKQRQEIDAEAEGIPAEYEEIPADSAEVTTEA